MKRGFLLTVVSVLAICLASADSPSPQLVIPFKTVSVHDGDTLTIDLVMRVNVRLLDCSAPEVTGEEKPDGLKAKAKLESIVLGKSGILTVPLGQNLSQSFTFGRVLGRINVDGVDVSEEMVASGLATKVKP